MFMFFYGGQLRYNPKKFAPPQKSEQNVEEVTNIKEKEVIQQK